jgi:serine/threonine protein phosphatase 1
MSTFRRLFSKRPSLSDDHAVPRPDEPLAIVGDIHGRLDLLEALLARLDQQYPQARKVFVGDYVDRGPDSRAVVERLRQLQGAICLIGNHEEMMLEFVDDPKEGGLRWLRNGGRATLASYEIDIGKDASAEEIQSASRALAQKLAQGTGDWLRALPRFWQSGTVFVTHAGPNPSEPIPGQPDSVFTWGHNRFLRQSRSDGYWVAHGHWIQERPVCANSRISVDTGAVFSGRLTAGVVQTSGKVDFVVS